LFAKLQYKKHQIHYNQQQNSNKKRLLLVKFCLKARLQSNDASGYDPVSQMPYTKANEPVASTENTICQWQN